MTAPDTYEDLEDIEFGGPGTYRIVVQGALSEEWSDRLAGLSITVVPRAGSSPRSHLTGPIRDQAELQGVLESLYELHLSILEVERIRPQPEELRPAAADTNWLYGPLEPWLEQTWRPSELELVD